MLMFCAQAMIHYHFFSVTCQTVQVYIQPLNDQPLLLTSPNKVPRILAAVSSHSEYRFDGPGKFSTEFAKEC